MSYKLFFFVRALNLFYYVPNLLASPIIGGNPDTSNTCKYHVSIQHRRNHRDPEHFCGGAIIEERYVLTAAHCFMTKTNRKIEFTRLPTPTNVVVLAGTSETYGPGIITNVHKVFIPRAYNEGQEQYGDIAIVELAADLNVKQNSDRLKILRLDPGHPLNFYENEYALVPGNGNDALHRGDDGIQYPSVRVAEIRHVLEVYMLAKLRCPHYFDHSICAYSLDRSTIHACSYGDSGSPLVYEGTIIGVLYSAPKEFSDEIRPVMRFTRVTTFMHFIKNAMNEHGDHSQMYMLDDRIHYF